MLRRQLLLSLLVGLCGCGDDGATPVMPDADHGLSEFTVSNMDDSGDLHSFTLRCSDLLSQMPLTITTDGPHLHTLQLSVSDLQMILAGMTVEARFTEGHEHFFSITKPADACTGY